MTTPDNAPLPETDPATRQQKPVSPEELKAILDALWQCPDIDPDFTEDDLYDEQGLPVKSREIIYSFSE